MAEVPVKSSLPRKSAFSCEACRKRKVKCNGASPSCSRCAARGEVCVYSLAPTLSYTKTLEARVAQLEDALVKLQGPQSQYGEKVKDSPQGSTGEYCSSPGQQSEHDERGSQQDLSGDFEGLKVEDDGRISFHGPTSLFQLPSGVVNETSATTHLALELEARKERLINNAWRERAFEQLAAIPEPFQYLLDSHWCWIQPLFNFVYRPAFTRDMKINGPYYSDILLNAILSHSVRWCKLEPKIGPLLAAFDGGAEFFHRSVTGLYDTLKSGYVKIPTIQTLLLLSAQECGRGNRTQAWLYSGMAFRLVDDLGISIDSQKYSGSAHFSDEDIEIRNRLFWSCYFWDKLVSLYFGRSPVMQYSRVSPPRMILDDTSEIEVWTPHGVVFPEGMQYPPAQAHSTSCFMRMCGLAEILNQIIIHIYDPVRKSTETEFYACVQQQGKNLKEWWEELPDFLKLVATDLPLYCPPSHIVTLNCLYHTINILLHRPILCSGPLAMKHEAADMDHLVQCMSSATTILSLFDLYRRTFGDGHVVLSLAYSVYTAASIFLLEIQALKLAAPGTLDKLKYCIIALERVKVSNPVITTAIGLIYQELQKLQIDIHVTVPMPQTETQRRTTSSGHLQGQHSGHASRQVSPSQAAVGPLPPISPPQISPDPTTMMPGYSFQQPLADPELSQTTVPSIETFNPMTTHHVGGFPGAAINTDGAGTYGITPEVFEAFSYVEPIATNMTPAYDSGWGMGGQP
ncbi:transcriptional regulator family: Fungal Specific TF [Paecilomyces variotii]|nr:transcriptional regulator family: Fungal Specific TF [Paecilomyces variotii]